MENGWCIALALQYKGEFGPVQFLPHAAIIYLFVREKIGDDVKHKFISCYNEADINVDAQTRCTEPILYFFPILIPKKTMEF
jgi:hypothetical protein